MCSFLITDFFIWDSKSLCLRNLYKALPTVLVFDYLQAYPLGFWVRFSIQQRGISANVYVFLKKDLNSLEN